VVTVNVNQMNNLDKAIVYDNCLRESDALQRQNSKLKSEYAGNIPQQIQEQINITYKRMADLVAKLESLFK
jgi:hypothetical protein